MEPLPYLKEVSLKRELIDSFNEYPFSIPVVKELDSIVFGKEVTMLVSETSSGEIDFT